MIFLLCLMSDKNGLSLNTGCLLILSVGNIVSSGSSTNTHAPSSQRVSLGLLVLGLNFAARDMKAELQTVEMNYVISFYLLRLLVVCKLQKVNLLMVGEYTEVLVLNCYIYKFCMILKLPISRQDNRYLKYRSLTDIRFFTTLIA
ncbi:hypothetical protein Hanom_Chr04g00344211 [Helianthus anomalus]